VGKTDAAARLTAAIASVAKGGEDPHGGRPMRPNDGQDLLAARAHKIGGRFVIIHGGSWDQAE